MFLITAISWKEERVCGVENYQKYLAMIASSFWEFKKQIFVKYLNRVERID